MMRYLAIAIWPVGLAIVFAIALLMARRAPAVVAADGGAPPVRPRAQHRSRASESAAGAGAPLRLTLVKTAKVAAVGLVGAVVVYGIMDLLGLLVVHHGLTIDRPIHNWMLGHQTHAWAAVMNRLTKIGNTWTTWGACAAAAVCLAVTMRTNRWLPPVVFAVAIFVDHYTTLALRHTFHRLGPPQSPLGTYPSGGCDRVILFYGLIAYLLWHEFSRQRRTGIWAGAVIAGLGINEAYSRIYLSLHWTTDALSGLLYGTLLLSVFILAIRVVSGQVAARTAPDDPAVTEAAVQPAPGGLPA